MAVKNKVSRFLWPGCFIFLFSVGCQSGDPTEGKILFQNRGCSYCHTIGKGKRQGPDLKNVAYRVDRETLKKWLADPEMIYKETGRRPLHSGYSPMPRVVLTEEEINDLVAFLNSNPESF